MKYLEPEMEIIDVDQNIFVTLSGGEGTTEGDNTSGTPSGDWGPM